MKKITLMQRLMAVVFVFANIIFANGQCLSVPGGQYPTFILNSPICDGQSENVLVPNGWAGEYSMMSVVEGQTYTFKSSVPTDYITISNADATHAYVHGVTPLTWTATVTADVRYIHTANAACGQELVDRVRSFTCGTFTTEQPDFVSLHGPATATVTSGVPFTASARVFKDGLTNAGANIPGEAPGIQAWIAVSTENTDPATWTNFLLDVDWIEAVNWTSMTHNPAFVGDSEEYLASVGEELPTGTYYYAIKVRLNDGTNVYAGISSDGTGGVWDGATYGNGVLNVLPPAGSLNGMYSVVTTRLETGALSNWANEEIFFMDVDTYKTTTVAQYYGSEGDPGTGVTLPLAVPDAGYTFQRVGDNILVETQGLASGAYSNEIRQTPAQYALSTINTATGVITVEYSVFFTGNTVERPFRSVYTPHQLSTSSTAKSGFSYAPNPVRDILNLSNLEGVSKVSVQNMLGQVVKTFDISGSDAQLDLSFLSKGTYLLKVHSDRANRVVKIVKE